MSPELRIFQQHLLSISLDHGKSSYALRRTSTFLPTDVLSLSSAVLLKQLSFSGNFRHVPLILRSSYSSSYFFFKLHLVNLQSVRLGNFTPNIILNAIRDGA